jgi:hypothetical protein
MNIHSFIILTLFLCTNLYGSLFIAVLNVKRKYLANVVLILTYFSYFGKKLMVGSCDHHAVCVSVYPPINSLMAEPVF